MPVERLTDSMLEARVPGTAVKYPNPFFSLADNSLPKNIKTLFKYCRDFYHTNAFLRNVIKKLTEYPITDILYNSTVSPEDKKKYDSLLNDKLKIKSFLIGIGTDFYTFGNSFISVYILPTRYLKCTKCGEEHPIDDIKYKMKENFSFYGPCRSCGATDIKLNPVDQITPSIENFRLLRWAPENIDIEWNPITNSATYYYKIPEKVKQDIIKGNKTVIKDIPLVFLESLKNKKKIEMDPKNFFHFKAPGLAEEDMAWGKPLILPALKDIYYLQTLRRGNEAIANEHIVPKKAIYPGMTSSMDPYSSMNLGEWQGKVTEQIRKWKSDPNHIAVFPIPIGYSELGGNAKMLLLTPEMKFLEETIINSLGVPIEFIKGGTSWSGSSVSLRIVENGFLTYRELLLDFLNYFLVPRIGTLLEFPLVKLHFKKFKMADDSESKQLYVNLNQAGKISDARLLDEFGLDFTEEQAAISKSRESERDERVRDATAQAEANGEAQLVNAKYQAAAQQAMTDETFKIRAAALENEFAAENINIPEDSFTLVTKMALQLIGWAPEEQQAKLQEMSKKMPITASLVAERLQELQIQKMNNQQLMEQYSGPVPSPASTGQPQQATGAPPPNKKEVGSREQDKIKLKKEKTKGQTRGNV